MHTPEGFVPSHVLPPVLPAGAFAFAFRDDPAAGRRSGRTRPAVPPLDALAEPAARRARSITSASSAAPHASPSACRTMRRSPQAGGMRDCARCSSGCPSRCSRIAGRAFQIVEWDRTHRYCGRCGAPTRDKPGERAKECPACGHIAYPRVSPAMMVLVTRGRELLLARAPRFPPGMYSALAGFVEPGETIEDCIRREVREEVGDRGRQHHLLREPVVGVPAFADDRLHRRVRGRRIAARCKPRSPKRAGSPATRCRSCRPRVSISRRLIEATVARLAGEAARS